MRQRFVLALLVALLLAGCSGRSEEKDQPLTFEEAPDTAGLAIGEPVLTGSEPFRSTAGDLKVRGRMELPDGTRVQLSIYRGGTTEMLARLHVVVQDGQFQSPPIIHAGKPLPPGNYRFEYFTLFNPAWQTPEVLRITSQGRALRGPGVTRDQTGGAAFFLVEERTL